MALLLLTYANFVNILFQEFVYFEDKTGQHNSVIVPYIKGTVEYFGEHHWPCFHSNSAFGILTLLLLILYPIVLMVIAYFEWDNTSQVHALRRWIPVYKLMPVYDTFWSEFKPNCQVFAGLYFLYRFLAFALFALVPTIYQEYRYCLLLQCFFMHTIELTSSFLQL